MIDVRGRCNALMYREPGMKFLLSALVLLLPAVPAAAEEPVLPAPTGVTAVQSGTSLVASWQSVPQASWYTATAQPGGATCSATTTTCTFENLPTKTSYTVTVTATDGVQTSAESAPSEPVYLRARLAQPVFESGKVFVGKSLKGRKIWAQRQGDPLSVNIILTIGQMHGSEPAGLTVVDRVRDKEIGADADYQLWTIRTMNPDGAVRGNRYNARGVDLNRNFPGTWSRQARTGGKAASEPETRAVMRFIRRLQPTGVLSFHQPWNTSLSMCDERSAYWVQRSALLIGLRVPGRPSSCGNWLPGTMNRWTTRTTAAWFVTVELAPQSRVAPQIPRAADAVITMAEEVASGGVAPAGNFG